MRSNCGINFPNLIDVKRIKKSSYLNEKVKKFGHISILIANVKHLHLKLTIKILHLWFQQSGITYVHLMNFEEVNDDVKRFIAILGN